MQCGLGSVSTTLNSTARIPPRIRKMSPRGGEGRGGEGRGGEREWKGEEERKRGGKEWKVKVIIIFNVRSITGSLAFHTASDKSFHL